MLKNQLKVVLRHLWKDKLFTLINLIGLTVGFTAIFCIATYLYHESSFDRKHPNGENTFRLLASFQLENSDKTLTSNNFLPVGDFLNRIPEVEELVRLEQDKSTITQIGNEVYTEKGLYWADNSIFNFFNFQFKQGSVAHALADPNTLVITESRAKKLFGTTRVVGKTLHVNQQDLTITGVIADLPSNTHLDITMIGSIRLLKNLNDPWVHQGTIYLRLKHRTNLATTTRKINQTLAPNIWWLQKPPVYSLQRIQDIHLHSKNISGEHSMVDINYLYLFGLIGLLIVVTTVFNYIGITIANITTKAKDLQVKRILGAGKRVLMTQPFLECLFLCLISAGLAEFIMLAALPAINTLFGAQLSPSFLISLPNLSLLSIIFSILVFVSSLYPIISTSSFRIVPNMHSQAAVLPTIIGNSSVIRQLFTVMQFMIVICLTISIVVIKKQLTFLSEAHLGFNKEQVIVLKTPRFNKKEALKIKQQLLQLANVDAATISIGTPFGGGMIFSSETEKESFKQSEFQTDEDFLKTLGIQLIKGRNLTSADSNRVLVNETMVKIKGWKDALGEKVDGPFNDNKEVVGVVKDFQMNNIYTPIHPAVIALGDQYVNSLLVRIKTEQLTRAITQISDIWKKLLPDQPLEYTFLDEEYHQLFASEIQFRRLIEVASTIAVIIACLGLYGFIAQSAIKRTKEIGIRKVLGASVTAIIGMLSADFIKLVLLAFIIASPIAWWVMNKWLEDFAYHIDIQWWMFALAGLGAVVIALLTVSYQAIKAAIANPVDSLRSE